MLEIILFGLLEKLWNYKKMWFWQKMIRLMLWSKELNKVTDSTLKKILKFSKKCQGKEIVIWDVFGNGYCSKLIKSMKVKLRHCWDYKTTSNFTKNNLKQDIKNLDGLSWIIMSTKILTVLEFRKCVGGQVWKFCKMGNRDQILS